MNTLQKIKKDIEEDTVKRILHIADNCAYNDYDFKGPKKLIRHDVFKQRVKDYFHIK